MATESSRGLLERLYQTYTEKAQLAKRAIEMLDAEERSTALVTAPKKFQQAINQRDRINGAEMPVTVQREGRRKKPVPRQSREERRAQIAAYLTKHPESTAEEIGAGINLHHNRVRSLLHGFAKPVQVGTHAGHVGWVLQGAKTTKRAPKQRAKNMTPAARLKVIREYLSTHPEATTKQVASAIALNQGGTSRLLPRIAKSLPRANATEMYRWVLKRTTKTKKAKALKRAAPARTSPAPTTTKGEPRKHRSTDWYAKPKLQGKAMTLFLLEHLSPATEKSAQDLADALAQAGSPLKSLRILNAPLAGVGLAQGWVARSNGGYRLTAKGHDHAIALRQMLETTGAVATGAYTA